MIQYRIKRFSYPLNRRPLIEDNDHELPSPKDLISENMKMQRQMMMNNRLRDKLQQEQRQNQLKQQAEAQKRQDQEDKEDSKNQLQAEKIKNQAEQGPKNIGSYKKPTTPNKPISMK